MKLQIALCAALLAACGNSGNAALSKSFNYGPPAAPSANEQAAGSSAQASVANTASFSAAPDPAKGMEVAGFAMSLASEALGDAMVGVAPRGSVQGALMQAATLDTCAKLSGNTVTFTNCTDGESGFTVTLNGSITAAAGEVSWGLTATFSGTSSTGSVSITMHHAGSISVSGTTLRGNATSDFGGTYSAQGQSGSFGFAVAVLLDLTYQSAPTSCVTAGTVEVKRVWTAKPNGASGAAFADAGVKLTWTGCNAFQVAHSQ